MTTTNFNKEQLIRVPIASETQAWLVERATDAEVITWTDTTRYITPKQAKDNYLNRGETQFATASDNLKYSADTEQTIGDVWFYTKKKEIQINVKWTIRVSYTWGTTAIAWLSKANIYVNWNSVWEEQIATTNEYKSYTMTTLSVNVWDLVQLYLVAGWTWMWTKCKNFRIYYDKSYIADWIVNLN